jgi:hypothetical protein
MPQGKWLIIYVNRRATSLKWLLRTDFMTCTAAFLTESYEYSYFVWD